MYDLLNSLDWKILPDGGGLLDQDELLFSDLMSIHARKQQFEEHKKVNESGL